jgi:uncharacterized protein YbjT (DUF2867 family)
LKTSRLILVTGATGYIAGRLIPRLLDAGHRVRALARRPHQLDGRGWSSLVDIVPGDVMDAPSLASVLMGVDTAYYLIHNMSSGRGYPERELDGARNFASAAADAGVRHIIYLGGLADPEQQIAPHMRSRIETGATLRQGRVPVTEFRAGVIAGSGSTSFEMIRFMTELCPIIPGPIWLRNKSQPIAVQNVVDYLVAALENHNGYGQIFEIGSPEVTSYGDLMLRYARLRGHKRRLVLLPHIPIGFMAFGISLVTPVPKPIAYALVGGLSSDSLVLRDHARRVFPEVNLIDFDSAVAEALTHLHPARIERVWDDGQHISKSLKHEGFFVEHRETKIAASLEKIFAVLLQQAGKTNWLVEDSGSNQKLLIHKSHIFGDHWLEWHVSRDNISTCLTQTTFLAPRGPGGFIFWVLLFPFRAFAFRSLLRTIAKRTSKG